MYLYIKFIVIQYQLSTYISLAILITLGKIQIKIKKNYKLCMFRKLIIIKLRIFNFPFFPAICSTKFPSYLFFGHVSSNHVSRLSTVDQKYEIPIKNIFESLT